MCLEHGSEEHVRCKGVCWKSFVYVIERDNLKHELKKKIPIEESWAGAVLTF